MHYSKTLSMTQTYNYKPWLFLISGVFFTNRIEGIVVLLAAFFVMVSKKAITFPFKLALSMLAVYAVSLFASYSVGYSIEKSIQQMIFITLFIFCYYQIFNARTERTEHIYTLFRAYLSVSLFMALMAIVQVVIYYILRIDIVDYLNINAFFVKTQGTAHVTETLIRGRAFAPEAGHLSTLLLPTVFYTFFYGDPKNVFNLRQKIILLIGSLLTFSPLTYIAYAVVGLNYLSLRFRHFRTPIFIAGVAFLAYTFITAKEKTFAAESSGIEGIQMRIIDTYKVFETFSDPRTIIEKNTSTAVLQSQLYSAFEAPSRWIGTGLGTNSQSFQNAFLSFYSRTDNYAFLNLNADDAYSLGIRLFSEMGVIGLLLYLWFVIRHFNRYNYLNICVLSIIIAYFFRGGSYFSYGIIFFHFFYYYTSKFNLTLSR